MPQAVRIALSPLTTASVRCGGEARRAVEGPRPGVGPLVVRTPRRMAVAVGGAPLWMRTAASGALDRAPAIAAPRGSA